MHQQLVDALVRTPNEAADDLLLEGLRAGTEVEQAIVLDALLSRKTLRGHIGVVERFDSLSPKLRERVLSQIKVLHHALREGGRSDRSELRLAAIRLIALSRQGKLAYVLSENLHEGQDDKSSAAVTAMVDLARWVADSTQRLQRDYRLPTEESHEADEAAAVKAAASGIEPPGPSDFAAEYRDLIEQRPEIETAIARALDLHRGKYVPDLVGAAMLLCDWPGSKMLTSLQTTKHGGQAPMVRRLQQTPDADQVAAFLLSASHAGLRSHFGSVFSRIAEPGALDALLSRTHWLKDHQLSLCMHQASRGSWMQESDLNHELDRLPSSEVGKIAEWLAASAMQDVVEDDRFIKIADRAKDHFGARLNLLRVAMRRKKGTSVQFLKAMLTDADERLMRLAAREIVRRQPPDHENLLLQLMTNAPESVRRVVSQSIGQSGFESYWQRFDRLDRPTRKQAGRAMLKLLPDAAQLLIRRLTSGPVEQRLKALQMTQELGLAEPLKDTLATLAVHPHPKVRSKAVGVLGELASTSVDVLLERVLNDTDSRVRANAIEVLETRPAAQFVPLLAQRAKSNHNRERANAIKALNRMRVGSVSPQLVDMLRDQRPEHRISAMWALKQMGWWRLLKEVGRLAREDDNLRVRRYAVSVLRGVAELAQASEGKSQVPESKVG
jgi:HEAT repeat protein